MNNCVWLDGDTVSEASIGAMSSAVMYGKGIFTSLTVIGSKPLLWDKHWKRLTAAAKRISIDISAYSDTDVLAGLRVIIEAKGLEDGRARITFLDGRTSSIWAGPGEATRLLIAAAEKRPRPAQLKLALSTVLVNSTSTLAGIKSCNYLDHLMPYEESRARGFDEAIRLNEKGHITSACMANVFWESDGKLYTPSLSTGCLAGTTREFVMENLECEEVEAGIAALEAANRIFLTSAGLGVTAAVELNGRPLDTSEHPMLNVFPA